MTVSGSTATNTDGQKTVTGQAAVGTSNVKGVANTQYSTNGNQQSASVGIGGQTTTGKTTTITIFGIKISW